MEALQAELAALVQAGVRVKKAPPPLGPFPLAVRFPVVETPPDAALFDVDGLTLTATIPCLGCGRGGVSLTIAGLPPRVAAAATDALKAAWVASPSLSSSLSLASLPALAAAHFVSLITVLPDCVEAYQSVDASGGTVRRRAIIDTDAPPTVVVDAATAKAPPPKPALSPGEAELAYLARRFKTAFALEGDDGAAFRLDVTPTDPEWKLGPVSLSGSVGPSYPAAGGLALAAIAPRGPATAALAKRLEGLVAGVAGRADGLRALVKEVENRASELAEEKEDQRRPPPSSSGGPPSILRLTGLRLDGVDALTPTTLVVQTACAACGDAGLLAALDFNGDRAVVLAPTCKACGAKAHVQATPSIAHAGSNAIARIRAEGCTPVDLVAGTILSAQCGRCDDGVAGLRLVLGETARRKCPTCFGAMAASFEGVAFEVAAAPLGPPGGGQGGKAAGSGGGQPSMGRRPPTRPVRTPLVPGTPLPATGTCVHYKHSHRWFFYECCGWHPCDLCHEASMGCPGGTDVRAKRMACGFCSTISPFAAKCPACDKRLTASSTAGTNAGAATSRFWEGGDGCRDPSRMDARDPRRWAGRNKTASRKAERVGPEGAARRKEREKEK